VERITFQSEETGYTVARLLPDREQKRYGNNNGGAGNSQPSRRAVKGEDNLVTIVGALVGVAAGEALELTGLWQHHTQHGWQFKVENYRSVLPATEQGIRKYLGSGLIKGIGPKTAEKIVAFFGLETLEVLENQPERLNEVPRLGPHKARLIAKAWIEQKAIKEVMVFLQGHGVSTSLAVRIYKEYGDSATTIVKNEPYRLAREVWGIGFKTADKIAQSLGFTLDHPERIKAGTLFVLSEASDSGGHTYLPRPRLIQQTAELLGVSSEQVDQAISGLVLEGGVQVETLSVDEEDGSLRFEPLVAVTILDPANFPALPKTLPEVVAPRPGGIDWSKAKGSPGWVDPSKAKAEPTETKAAVPSPLEHNHPANRLPPVGEPFVQTSLMPAPKPASIFTSSNNKKLEVAEAKPQFLPVAPSEPAPEPELVGRVEAGSRQNTIQLNGGSTPTLSALPGEQAVYLPPFFYAEQGIAKSLRRLAKCSPHQDRLVDLKQLNFGVMFEYLATKEGLKLADRQEEGVVMALVKSVGVLTGGPGTGKTTSMKALIRVLTLKKKRVILAAPTGRAAKRLSEATGLEAKTLHRLLALKPGGKSQYDQEHPLPADIVIVDETSMLDTLLMNNLLKAVATGTHLLLVGDADQLPSVGAGNVLADIIGSGVVPVTRLDHIFRQGAGSAIVTNAHRINQGLLPQTSSQITDFFFFGEDDPEKAGDLVVELVAKRIPAKFGFQPDQIQVLAPMHRGKCGVGYLNEKLQEVLNPPAEGKGQKQFGGRVFRVGDKVLQLRNNYDKEVFNGDGGVVTTISYEDQTVGVKLEDGREVNYDFGELDELTLAYAVSIHKSQGSEYPVCVIPLAMGHFMLLERKLVYTAVTRARKLVVLVGSKKALAMAVKNGPTKSKNGPEGSWQQEPEGHHPPAQGLQHRAGRFTGLAVRLQTLF
jgi:ATP-dependent exoDNAse (exonuclease V) alpha subunit